MSDARWRPIPINHRSGGNNPRLLIIHTIVGSLAGADSWFRNPSSRVSAHFGVGKDGTIYQWVDTNDTAWANVGANPYSISIENEGQTSEALTADQVEANAKIYAWAHRTHGIPFQYASSSTGSGLGYHSQFGNWSLGGTGCPGSKRVAQRAAIMSRAAELAGGAAPKPPSGDTGGNSGGNSGGGNSNVGAGITTVRSYVMQQSGINDLRYILGHATRVTQDNAWGPETAENVEWLQRIVGADVDGKWGKETESKFDAYVEREGWPRRFSKLTVDGKQGPNTKRALQIYLGVKADGIIGPVTVRKLQKKVGATQDGDWGPQTTSKLQESLNGGTF